MTTPAALPLPEHVPEVGQLVLVRSRRWLVEEVIANSKGSSLVRLACADDDAQGQSLEGRPSRGPIATMSEPRSSTVRLKVETLPCRIGRQ